MRPGYRPYEPVQLTDTVQVRHTREISTLERAVSLAAGLNCGLRVTITETNVDFHITDTIPADEIHYAAKLRLP